MLSKRASMEVPERCIPRTKICMLHQLLGLADFPARRARPIFAVGVAKSNPMRAESSTGMRPSVNSNNSTVPIFSAHRRPSLLLCVSRKFISFLLHMAPANHFASSRLWRSNIVEVFFEMMLTDLQSALIYKPRWKRGLL